MRTYFVFDRGGVAKLSECCRLSFELTPEDLNEAKHPWKMRYCALQNITLNLPRAAYKCNGDQELLFEASWTWGLTDRLRRCACLMMMKVT